MDLSSRKMYTLNGEDATVNSTMYGSDQHNSILCLGNFIKFMFLLFFAVTILTFPTDEIKQWAARKPWLRKVFNLQDVPI